MGERRRTAAVIVRSGQCMVAGKLTPLPPATCPPLPRHLQVFFSRHNPIFARGLSPLMRWMYGSVILSYFSAFTSTPLLMLVPMVTVGAPAPPGASQCQHFPKFFRRMP